MIKGIQKQLLEDFNIFEADNIDGTDNDDGEKVLPTDVQHGFKSKVISKDIINPMLQELEVSGEHIVPTEQTSEGVLYTTYINEKEIVVEFETMDYKNFIFSFSIDGGYMPKVENRKYMFKIYSYVINVLKSFIKDFNPDRIYFEGATESQDKIYSLLIKMLSNSIKDLDYTIDEYEKDLYVLIKNTDMNESILNELDISNLGYIKPEFKSNNQYMYKTDIDGNEITLGIDFDNNKNYWDVAYEIDGDFFSNSEKTGIAMKVYGYVISCLKSFIKDQSPDVINFYGFDGNQDKVYGMLLRSLNGYLKQNGYDVSKKGKNYRITKDKDIQEMKRFAGL